ncbi:hypothetical protein H9651_01145 [Microbacterium sp. Sa4CUA7]|uniref:Uncharacterized protein n=1 Tax=Microbacterium pullorum TaxID=2762236 RepID=A0ABR8RYC2_9MICO|nr:hypothetical protein [Microbacterium pullorum]MBD7956242.1 hypothetical protein [Microbacterium pullorum]
MTIPPRDTAGGPFAATLVVNMPVTKLDALDVIAYVADAEIEYAGTADPRVPLAPGAWAEVQIPKFADPPPLAIDVCSDVSAEHAQEHADRLAAALTRVGWMVRSARDGER